MRSKRIAVVVAAAAALALVSSSCAPNQTNTPPKPAVSQSIKVSVGPNDFISYNGYTPTSYSTYNSAVVDQIKAVFFNFGPTGEITENTDLGTVKLLSENPMKVEYTISDKAVWSDGTPITVADAVFAWGVQNGNLTTKKDGKDVALFDAVSADMGTDAPKGPQGDPAGKKFTIDYAEPNPDYKLQTLMLDPAHVVAKQAGLSLEDLVAAFRAGDVAKLAPVAEFWNNGWTTEPGKLPSEDLIPSSGPYVLSSWEAGQSVTVKANPKYYGTLMAPKNEELVIRFVAQDAMVQALSNGDLDVAEPQPLVDTVKQLEGLRDKVTTYSGPSMTWEHLDFNFRPGTVFASDLNLRKAFAMCVPRQQIIDNLIKPLDPEAKVLNSREAFPFQENYDEIVKASYDGAYDQPNLEEAKKLVEAAGATGKEVRIGYSAPNPRRTDQVAMIKSSCDQVGFKIKDVGSEDFFKPGGVKDRGDYDVALFAWAGSGQITSGENIYATNKPQNYGKYSNPEVDKAWDRLTASLDPKVHLEETKKIEKLLWDDLFGIPVFAHPGVDAARNEIAGPEHNATQTGILWNSYSWTRKEV